MKKVFLTLATLAIAIGCSRAQVPPATSHQVVLNWTAPAPSVVNGVTVWAGCGSTLPQSPCVYAVYSCNGTAASCGDTSSTSWHEVTSAATRPSALTFTDASPLAGADFYVVKTIQGSASSGASNIAPATVPGVPGAPALATPTVAENEPLAPLAIPKPQEPELAMTAPMHLTARVER